MTWKRLGAVTIAEVLFFSLQVESRLYLLAHNLEDFDMAPAAKSTKRKQLTEHSGERPSKKAHKQKEVEQAVEEEQEFDDTEMAEGDEYEGEEEIVDEENAEDAKPKQSRFCSIV